MRVKVNPVTGEVTGEVEIGKLVEDSIKVARALATKISDVRKRKQIEKFLACRWFLGSNRRLAATLAKFYYPGQELKTLDETVPILYKDGWIPPKPIDLAKVGLEWSTNQEFNFDESIFANQNILPLDEKRYSSLLNECIEDIILYDAPTYRLMEIKNPTENDYLLKFGLDTYFNYVDTCELLAYELSKEIVKQVKANAKFTADSLKDRARLRLRSQIYPLDFANRSAAVGINTILIVLDNKHASKFYLHERGTELAEAMNTISVVPAGTFEPRHTHDAYHTQDFDLYVNLMREFGEELLGKEEFTASTAKLSDIFETGVLKKINIFVKKGLIKVYFLGIGLDCLTTKPEILTALVLERETVDSFLWNEFKDCFEGQHFEVEFSKEQLKRFLEDERIAPAGAACLWLTEKNFEFFRNIFEYTPNTG
ncbi:hypothetical protein ACFLYG_03985 [Chloroflexota bacterium]